MKTWMLAAAFLLPAFAAHADQTLTDQINAVHAVEVQQQQAEQAAQAASQAAWERQIAEEKAQQARADKARNAAAAARAADAKADKSRNQAFEDKLRELEVERQTTELQKQQKRAKREDDFIDQELNMQKAQADVVQSNADANRNLSEGAKSLLTDTGKAKVEDASSWW